MSKTFSRKTNLVLIGIVIGLFVGVSIRQAFGGSDLTTVDQRNGNLAVNIANIYQNGLLVPYGNVGIGVLNPAVKLDVNGYVKSTTAFCLGNTCIDENQLKTIFGGTPATPATPATPVTPATTSTSTHKLPPTGITAYSDATDNNVDASVATDTGAFPRQDARYARSFDYTRQGTWGVLDNITGLTWEVAPSLTLYTWADTASYVSSVNATSLGGHSDWRMPTVKELESLVDYSIHPIANKPVIPTIDTEYFPNTSTDHQFWTSEAEVATHAAFAWSVDFLGGSVSRGNQVSWLLHVRLVRGPSTPSQFVSTDNGSTVTDNSTGLMWKRDYEMLDSANPGTYLDRKDTFLWSVALQRAVADRTGGYTDWRVPNVRELHSLVDRSVSNPSINQSFFPAPPQQTFFYSSSPTYDYKWNRMVWVVNFDYGQDILIPPYMTSYVRLVRDVMTSP